MTAVWMRMRSELRSGWRAWLSLAMIFGLAGEAATAAAAGARRTESAYPRFLEANDAFDAVTGGGAEGDFDRRFATLKSLPEIADYVEFVFVGGEVTIPPTRGKPELTFKVPELLVAAEPTGRFLYSTNRAKVVEGRLPDLTRADETTVPFVFADRNGVEIGDTITAGIGFSEDFSPVRRVPLRVVGIHAAPGEFEAVGQTAFLSVYATPALLEKYRDILPPPNPETWSIAVHLKGGPDAAYAFKQKVERDLGFDVPFIDPVVRSGVQKTMGLYSAALWLLAALVALAAIAVFGQTLARQMILESAQYPALRAVGMTKSQLFLLGIFRALATAVVALPLGVGTAFLLSPLSPIGSARLAEPDPGFAFDGVALGIGACAMLGVVVLLAVLPSLRAARLAAVPAGSPVDARSPKASRIVASVHRASRSPAIASGLSMALEPGRGRTAVPVRSTILAVATGIAAVTASLVVGRSLSHLIDTPALAGFTYDAIVLDESEREDAAFRALLVSESFVEHATTGTGINIEIRGIDSFLVGLDAEQPIAFALIEGRSPTDRLQRVGSDEIPEIALGPATMRRLDLRIGDIVTFNYSQDSEDGSDGPRVEQDALVVGRAAIPPLPWAATEPGEGGVMTMGAINSFTDAGGGCCFVRFRAGVDLARARVDLERKGFQTLVRTKRADLGTLERITGLPALLATIFGVIALAALAHVLTTGIRRRRRDLAILKTIGFVNRQIRAAVAWQASAIAVLCVVVGIPAGIAFGRWGWAAIADEFGVVPVTIAPLLPIGVAIPAAILLANVIAVLPARAAARTRAAVVLRSE